MVIFSHLNVGGDFRDRILRNTPSAGSWVCKLPCQLHTVPQRAGNNCRLQYKLGMGTDAFPNKGLRALNHSLGEEWSP